MYPSWFVWAVAGIACIGLEMILPGLVIIFFGLGGLVTALFCLVPGIAGTLWLQIVLFIVSSTLSLVFLRRRFARIFQGTVFDPKKANPDEAGLGGTAEVTEEIAPDRDGRIRYLGTTWKARCGTGTLAVGSTVRVLSRENMTYIVEMVAASGAKGEK